MAVWDQLFTSSPAHAEGRFFGVAVGVVTSNVDPDKLGRVKVQFPWLSADDTSHWARVAVPMAGKGRGFFFIPEVDDEVLVAFEHGMIDRPFVIGCLWNGVDEPPEQKDESKNPKSITTTSGHVIRLDDTEGAEKIEIIDSTGNNSVTIDSAENTIAVVAEKDLTITAKGSVTVEGKDVEIKAGGAFKVNGKTAELTAQNTTTVKGKTVEIN